MRRPAELDDRDRSVLHFPVAERQRRDGIEAYEDWKAKREQPARSAWWSFVAYAFWFGLGMLASAYLTWMAS